MTSVVSIRSHQVDADTTINLYETLPFYYAGISNEILLNGFVLFSPFDVLSYHSYPLFLGLVLLGWLIYILWKTVPSRRITKECCFLAEDVVYDPVVGCIYKHREPIKLYPKSNAIIKALLEAENHQLHGADLLSKVWDTNECNIEKLYVQNSLIRKVLKQLGNGFRIESVEGGYFKLVFPYASKMKKR